MAETGSTINQMLYKEYCMKMLLYIGIVVMFGADIFVLLAKIGVFGGSSDPAPTPEPEPTPPTDASTQSFLQ